MRKRLILTYAIVIPLGVAYCMLAKYAGVSIPCLLYAATKIPCAGCGTTRMFSELLSLNFKSAFSHNPVMFVLFFFWNFVGLAVLFKRPAFAYSKAFVTFSVWGTAGIVCGVIGIGLWIVLLLCLESIAMGLFSALM